ncbi:MAG: hypothetical protein ABJL67_13380 [Sulfitobacter sp.]
MDQDLQWVIGAALTTLLFIVGTLIASFRSLAARISRCTGELHGRIDDVKEKYVRRDDLDSHLRRLDESIVELRREVRDGQIQVIEAIRTSKT